MTFPESRPSRESVLESFAVESETGRATLERYLRDYPEFADDLIDLSLEIGRGIDERLEALDATDVSLIDGAWARYASASRRSVVLDPFASLAPDVSRKIADSLGLPRQVLTAFRERRVAFATVPRRFLVKLAGALTCSLAQLESSLGQFPVPVARSYKSDVKPGAIEQVTFERVLIDAGVSEARRAELLAESP